MMHRTLGTPHAWAGLLNLVAFCTGFGALGCNSEIPREAATAPPAGEGTAGAGAGGVMAGTKRIIILVNNPSPFWDACRAGVLDANRELKLNEAGLVASMEVPDGTIQGQLDRLRQFATQTDIAALGISPLESDNAAIADELKKLAAQGVKIVTFDSDLDRDKFRDLRTAFLGTNNYAGGVTLGTCAQALRADGGEYATFVGRTGAQNAIERIDGFAEGAGAKLVNKDTMADDGDRSRAAENVRNAIRNHPGLNTLVGIWSYNAPAIVDVVREQQNRKNFAITVFDADPLAIAAMKQGDIDVMVVQDPYAMGYQSVRCLKALLKDEQPVLQEMLPNLGQPDGDIYDTGLKVVVPSADSPIKADLFPAKVQHMTLSTFEEWLAKYGLSGS